MMVSAIMPTRGRRDWAAQALRSFLGQTHSPREIIIADDVDDRSFPEESVAAEADPRVRYVLLDRRLSIPEKRNLCCELAAGELIMHWDSDDWSAPARMADQVRLMERSGLSVGGYFSMLFWDHQNRLGYRYKASPDYAVGTSLVYRRDWWSGHKFPENISLGEDNEFVRAARNAAQIQCADSGPLMVARIHSDNSAEKNRSGGSEYRPYPTSHFPREFFL